ncbi:unnamed protein product [Lymnaea stagnalis]|uniref:Uncharacterized protein n=1 Tax=Lymnaea stagnalis TaxID=6523 RepID=A0AAV2IA31_LYMST
MRRSLSAVSQASMFSVCSETGEKKLKSTTGTEDDSRILPADSHYPEYHTLPMSRLSGPKTELQHFPACVSHARSKSDADGASGDSGETSRIEPYTRSASLELRQQAHAAAMFNMPAAATSALPSPPPPPQPYVPPSVALVDVSVAENKDILGTDEEKNYNLNTPQTDKSLLQKDLPPVYEEVRMSQSVNIPPLTPFLSSLSNKTVTMGTLKDNDGQSHANGTAPETVPKLEKSGDGLKKQKKKRTKDRNSSSPQLLHLAKTKHTSPKHLRVHLTERKKPDDLFEERDCKLKLSRPIDKKFRLQSVVCKQPVRFSDSHGVNKVMTRSAPDAPMMYGNADVYRGGGESFAPIVPHPLQQPLFPPYLDPWVHQDHQDFHDHNFGPRLGLNDLNQPPNHLKPSDSGVTVFPVCGTSALAVSKFQEINSHTRKKPGHRRQVAGDRLGYVLSPSRHKSRPKSLTAAVDNIHEKREVLSRPSAGNTDNVVAGKGARSGFGHDLNFEDQNGISDWYDVHEGDFTHKRNNLCHDGQHLVNFGIFKNTVKTEGPAEAACGANKPVGTIHPSSKSGLSNELSFVSRTAARPKKRQSMSASTGTFTQQNLQDRVSAGVGSPKQNEAEGSIMGREVRGDKMVHQSDMRHDRMAISDDNSEATSYV